MEIDKFIVKIGIFLENLSIVNIYYLAEIVSVILILAGFVITVISLNSYFNFKIVDSLSGYYSCLEWRIIALLSVVGYNDNILDCHVKQGDDWDFTIENRQIATFRHYRNSIIQFLFDENNQMVLNIKHNRYARKYNEECKRLDTNIKSLFDLLLKYDLERNMPYFDNQQEAKEEKRIFVGLMESINKDIVLLKAKIL